MLGWEHERQFGVHPAHVGQDMFDGYVLLALDPEFRDYLTNLGVKGKVAPVDGLENPDGGQLLGDRHQVEDVVLPGRALAGQLAA